MASTLWRSCSVFRTFSRLPNCAEIRCLPRTAVVFKPVLKSTSLPCKIQANGACVIICRDMHITRKVLMKKSKDELYEEVRVFNQTGEYLYTTEMLVVDKFCNRYNIFTFDLMETAPNSNGDDSLKAVQLIPKPKRVTENANTKVKTVKFKKDLNADDKMPRILGLLINTGKLNIYFVHERSKVEQAVRENLSKFSNISNTRQSKGSMLCASLKPIDNLMLISLLEAMKGEHAEHIASVKELQEFMKKES